ncbi:hypothetical protein M3Y98_00249400 [Aphelenchoides besseyi]|nr:hypothetical protein M3Y98_00249400 [Aphelenchoides besseyi]KAI6200759.1 hypothetical protein M3Y96_00768200 [Aphelenchoides besseyi]
MNPWINGLVLIVCTLWLQSASAQDFDSDSLSSFEELRTAKRRPAAELFGKRAAPYEFGYDREARRTSELFGKRQAYPIPSYLQGDFPTPKKRRTRELFGKRSVQMSALSDEQMEVLASLLTERQRRARGGELFG